MSGKAKRAAKLPRDWKSLRVGDRIRIVAIPEADQRNFNESGDNDTYPVLRRLAEKRCVRTISFIDSAGFPWIEYRYRNSQGKIEAHGVAICDNESWVRVSSRS